MSRRHSASQTVCRCASRSKDPSDRSRRLSCCRARSFPTHPLAANLRSVDPMNHRRSWCDRHAAWPLACSETRLTRSELRRPCLDRVDRFLSRNQNPTARRFRYHSTNLPHRRCDKYPSDAAKTFDSDSTDGSQLCARTGPIRDTADRAAEISRGCLYYAVANSCRHRPCDTHLRWKSRRTSDQDLTDREESYADKVRHRPASIAGDVDDRTGRDQATRS